MFYKQIIFMDGKQMRLTPAEALALERALLIGTKHLKLHDMVITLSTIARIEDSDEPLPKPLALPGATGEHEHEPEFVDLHDGYRPAVKTMLVKKKFTRKHYEKFLAGRSSQHVLENDGNWVWVAFKHVPCKDCGIMQEDAIECDSEEYATIWGPGVSKA